MTLDALIEDAFTSGCTGITIWLSADHGYQANARSRDGNSWRVEVDQNPARALRKALSDKPHMVSKPRRRSSEDLI